MDIDKIIEDLSLDQFYQLFHAALAKFDLVGTTFGTEDVREWAINYLDGDGEGDYDENEVKRIMEEFMSSSHWQFWITDHIISAGDDYIYYSISEFVDEQPS